MDYFATNSLAAFTTLFGAPTESNSGTVRDPLYSATAIYLPNTVIKSPQFINPDTGAAAILTEGWFHFVHAWNTTANHSIYEILNSAGTSVVRLWQVTSTGYIRPEYWNGSAWVTTAALFPSPAGFAKNEMDIHVVCGAAGYIEVYINNELASTITGLNAAVNNLAFITPRSSTANQYQSQHLVSDQNTVGAKVQDLVINANATYTAWSGDYTAVVEIGLNDATMISSSTLGDKESFNAADITLPSGYAVSSLWFSARGRLNSGSPGNFKALVRIGGTDYSPSYNFGGLTSAAYGPSLAAFTVDPSTSAAWTAANVNAAELGFVTAA